MVNAHYGPAGGFGDAIIVRESRAQRDGLFGGLIAIFLLAFGAPASRKTGSSPP